MAPKCRIMVMASGSGSNFQAVCEAVQSGRIPDSQIIRLIVNRGKAYATVRAENFGVPWEYFNLISHGFQAKGERDPAKIQEARNNYDAALAQKILDSDIRPHLIVLAGWMYVFGEKFLDPLSKAGITIINLHPALPGRHVGADCIERQYADFQNGTLPDNKAGIMIHHVIKQVDEGEAIMSKEIECREGETLDQFRERIHSHEHELLVDATAFIVKQILTKI